MEERIIDKYLSENITPEIKLDILKECTRYNSPSLLKLFSIILNSDNNNDKDYNTDNIHNKLYELIDSESYPSNFKSVKKFFNLENEILSPIEEKSLTTKRVLMLCNWSNSKDLCDHFNIMSKNSDYTWNNIEIVWEEPADFYCIINSPSYPTNTPHDPDRTIIFQMEPNMFKNEVWGDFSNPREDKYLYVGKHFLNYNNLIWHLKKTYKELCEDVIVKSEDLSNVLSTTLTTKYFDPGHRIRIDFMRFLESKGGIDLDIFGKDNNNWKNYKGSLPSVQKDDSLLPYKYTFNCENNYIRNYFTEKIIDAILCECLIFYSGCENVGDYIDERAYVYLQLKDFEHDYNVIKKAIEEDLWSKRLPYIKEAKLKILNELQFFPRVESILSGY